MDDTKIKKVFLPVSVEKQKNREEQVKSDFWPKFRAFAGKLPFAEDLVAAYYCAIDSNTPFKVRGTLLAALAYFIMPVDFIPDILAMVGFTDDIAVLSAAFAMVSQHVTEEHREKAKETLSEMGEEPASTVSS